MTGTGTSLSSFGLNESEENQTKEIPFGDFGSWNRNWEKPFEAKNEKESSLAVSAGG
jgi:hypothetical protein